ncbi:unnamed protein product [Rhizoctonia solani]|uniref:Uncharacterized protein n=1 Tax=Rhizoctonia solani TaxID=456999 RepID=A0A8H3CHK8_9AGAM|nr:unnamed protein product [Rhizoctonia solani]
MADVDMAPIDNRDEPIMIGSSDDEEDNIETRRTRRLGGPQGTPIPRRPDRHTRIFSPPPPNAPVRFNILQAIPFLDEIGQNELMRILLAERHPPRLAQFARSRPPEQRDPEPYDLRMTHASARPRLGFTFDFEQPEEEEKPQKPRTREPVKYKQTIEIPDSPPLSADKGKGKAVDHELVLDRHKEIIEIYSDEDEPGSIASSSQPVAPVKITSVLICAGCRRPLRTGGDRLWALRCGHMIDSRCYTSLSRPQFSSLPLIARLGSPPPGPATKRRKPNKEKGKGKGKGVMESYEWACPVKDCGKLHKSERMAGEEDWVPVKDTGAIKVFI